LTVRAAIAAAAVERGAGAAVALVACMRLRTRTKLQALVAAASLTSITACFSAPVGAPVNRVEQETPLRIAGNKVDVLFMIDNSSSMEPMQEELRKRFGDFLQIFGKLAQDGFYTDLHIGVVTSDFGAGDTDEYSSSMHTGCFRSPGGDRGKLQALGKAAAMGCIPPRDQPFIRYAYGEHGRDNDNLPEGQDLAATFTCMASVGASGCGFEHPLESVLSALKNNTDNAGFLRPEALLAVVFVTNEDDGSAPPDTHLYRRNETGTYGPYDTFRQARFGIACGNPLALLPSTDSGPLSGCVPANAGAIQLGAEYPIERYVQLFKNPSQLGGVKNTPADVLLFAIDGPESPVQVVTTNGVARMQHSCVNGKNAGFFADPAVRLNSVLRAVDPASVTASICGEDLDAVPDYTKALQRLADEIKTRLPGCIPVALADGNEANLCSVTQDIPNGKGGYTSEVVSRCETGKFPCWKLGPNERCAGIGEGKSLSVERNGVSAPPGATLRAACSTKVL
jgi:hypothetical protein